MVTHDPELARMARRVITLKDGRIISDTRDGISLMEEDARLSEEATTVRDRNTENVKERQTVQSVD